MPGEIVHLTHRDELRKYADTHRVVILKATATWCGPCKRCAPLVNKLFSTMPDNVSMVIVDIDDGRDIKSFLKITSVPTLYNIVNGQLMDSVVGSAEDHIRSFFKKTLSRAS